ncbi:uncharacterized protein PAC_16178 [Phialocephala subalpina]|uniref:C2H2-type domain-containing protein n=1 Tax=Phialocephala subalpina TaxID=576137 RepID=A0A1L7XMW4_9HELO|nr:uncharacterized protein PAC_16178 [Phialocephala subalpina]
MENSSSAQECLHNSTTSTTSTTSSTTSLFSDGDAGIGGAAPPTSALSPTLNGAAVPIITTSGNILGHLNLNDGLVHGIDGYILGIWYSQSALPSNSRDGIMGDGFQSHSPINSQTSPSNSGMNALLAYLSLPSTIEATELSVGPFRDDFDAASGASTRWSSQSSMSSVPGNWDAEITPTSFGVSNVWEWNLKDPVSETTWADTTQVPFVLDLDAISDNPDGVSSSPDSAQSCWQLSQAPSTPDALSATNSNANTLSQRQAITRFQCGHCNRSFKRDCDRGRHERSIHSATHGRFVCPIAGCPRSQGAGYCRADKVKEHLWKKHRDLGYVKGA